MALQSAQLLKQLEPAVRPIAAPAQRGAPNPALESQSFEQLLASASRGRIQSGRQIEMACEPSPPLDASQLERLAAAADQAQAMGAKRALMLIDGRGFVLNVESRTVVAELSGRDQANVSGIDAAIHVAASEDSQFHSAPLPGAGVKPAAVQRLLESMHQRSNS